MLERSQVFKLRAVEKDRSLTALAWIDQDQFKYREVCQYNNLRNKALFTLQVYGYPRVQVCRLVKYTRSSSSFGTSAVPRASLLELKYSADIFKHGWITRKNVAMLYIKEIRPLRM